MNARKIIALGRLALKLCLSTVPTISALSVHAQQYDPFVLICRKYQTGQYRNCDPIYNIKTGEYVRMHAYIEFDWLVPKLNRAERPVYFRWEWRPRGGEPVLLSNHRDNRDYQFVPKIFNEPSRWRVTQTAWPKKIPGVYTFYVFADLAAPDDVLASFDVEVVPNETEDQGASGANFN